MFWLEERWKLETEEDVQALRDAADLLGSASSVRTRALGELAARLTEPPGAPVDGAEQPADLITRLSDAGFLGVDTDNVDLTTFPPRPARAVVVTGTNSKFVGTDMTVETVSAFVDVDAPTVAGEVYVTSDQRRRARTRCRGRAGANERGALEDGVDGRRPRTRGRARRDRARAAGSGERRRRPLRLRERRNEQPAAATRPAMTPRALRRGRTTAAGVGRARPDAPWTRAAARMGAVTAVSRAFGFLRVLVIAAVLGTTYLGNAFQAANSVSNVLFELVAAGALSAVLVPTFVQLLDKGDDAEANRLASGLLGVALVGLGVVTVVGIIAAPLLARLLTAGVAERRGCRATTGTRDVLVALVPAAAAACTRAARSPPACSTRAGGSPSPPRRRSATRSSWSPRSSPSTSSRVPNRPSCCRPPSGCCW